jgi:ParB family chromosome partitioning protein
VDGKMTLFDSKDSSTTVVPTGQLLTLSVDQLRPNPANPRTLFDEAPLRDLKENIRTHGVLVPLTVYPLAGQDRFGILDGERRFICCRDLEDEGISVAIPANVVLPPNDIAGILYMFNIHNYREAWQLMPTALSLEFVMEKLEVEDDKALANLTGLDDKNVRRCKVLLSFPRKYQELSLDPDPKTRIPSNFWIELDPVLALYQANLPQLVARVSRDGLTDRFLDKYRNKRIKSVIDLRRILEARDAAEATYNDFIGRLEEFVDDPTLEIRDAFDEFVAESRRTQTVLRACNRFVTQVEQAQVEHSVENRHEVMAALSRVATLVTSLLTSLEGEDPTWSSDSDAP